MHKTVMRNTFCNIAPVIWPPKRKWQCVGIGPFAVACGDMVRRKQRFTTPLAHTVWSQTLDHGMVTLAHWHMRHLIRFDLPFPLPLSTLSPSLPNVKSWLTFRKRRDIPNKNSTHNSVPFARALAVSALIFSPVLSCFFVCVVYPATLLLLVYCD